MTTPDHPTTYMSDELSRREDVQSKYSTFEVIPDHEVFSDHGEQARDIREAVLEPLPEISQERTAEGVIGYMCKLAQIHPILPGIIAMRLMHPDASLRELCPGLQMRRSMLSDRFKQLVAADKGLSRFIYGTQTNNREGQKARRLREGAA